MRKTAFLALLLTICLSAVAQTVTRDEAQRLSRENYPLIKRFHLIQQTEQFTLSNIAKGWLPQISADAQATWQSDVTSWPSGMKSLLESMGLNIKGLKKDQYKIGVSINQQVYDGGAIAAQKSTAKAQARVQEAENEVSLYAIRDRVDEIFFSVLLTDDRIALCKEKQTVLQSNEDKLGSMQRGGIATTADVDAVRAERLSARQQQTQLESTREALLAVLSLYVGREVGGVVRPQAPPAAIARDAAGRPEHTLFDLQQEQNSVQRRALRSGLMPRLGVFASGYYGYPGYNMFEDMMQHEWSLNGMIGAKLSWNIGALYTNKNDKQKLSVQRQDIENAREVFLFNTRLQSESESQTIRGYRKVLAEDDEIIRLRRNVRMAAESKLTHGIVDVNTLVQEISRENQAQLDRSQHETELLQHQYKLANVNGIQ